MSIVSVVVVFIVIGVALWAVNQFVPMQPPFKSIVNLIVILCACLWLLAVFGIIPGQSFRLR